jgi:2-dehydropantoate 2-reductase
MSAGQIVGGIVKASSEVVAPGCVLSNSRSNSLLVGYVDDRSDARIVELREALAASGFASPPVQSIRLEVWLKLLRNMSSSSISAATGSGTGTVKQDARLAETFRRIVSEMMDVARASGFPLVGLADPDQMLAATDDVVPSLLQDLRIGRKVEVEDLLEAPLRFARERQVATPTTDAVVAIVRRLAADKGLL